MAEKVLTKEEMLRRINYAMAHTSLETADKYGFKSADAADRNIQRYAMAISNKPKIRCKLSDAEKKEMVEYYITHSGAKTAKKYGYSSANSAAANINHLADKIGYPKPLKYRTRRRGISKEEMMRRIKFYKENGAKKYADKYGYANIHSARFSIYRYNKCLKALHSRYHLDICASLKG